MPYIPGSEAQAIAVSEDGTGRNFTKLERGPVISSAPFGLNVTGWRDPFEFRDPVLDELTGNKEGTVYSELLFQKIIERQLRPFAASHCVGRGARCWSSCLPLQAIRRRLYGMGIFGSLLDGTRCVLIPSPSVIACRSALPAS